MHAEFQKTVEVSSFGECLNYEPMHESAEKPIIRNIESEFTLAKEGSDMPFEATPDTSIVYKNITDKFKLALAHENSYLIPNENIFLNE